MTDVDERVEELEIALLLEAIYRRYGYDLRGYAPSSLRRRVRLALTRSGLSDLGALQHALLTDPALFARVLEGLTVRVTAMFRDPPFYRALRERVVPHLRPYPLLRVWHAGCASGEEVYASAILLREEGLYDRAQVYATDISQGALQEARRGVYPGERLDTFRANYEAAGGKGDFRRYVTEAYEQLAMVEPLKRNLLFFHHDLVSDDVFGEMQLVFCRNVLMYFDEALKQRVVDKLVRSLRPGGFLCLGSGEQLPLVDRGLGFIPFVPEERIYRYAGGGGRESAGRSS
jgi:chemotaxis protein methyltransferase CheR